MKELTNEQIESIEAFKNEIEEEIKNNKSWRDSFESSDQKNFLMNVLSSAACRFEFRDIPFFSLYAELGMFCYEKRLEYLSKKELTEEQVETIENFKKHIEKLIEQKEVWITELLKVYNYPYFIFTVLNYAALYLKSQIIPFSILYKELTNFFSADFYLEAFLKHFRENK